MKDLCTLGAWRGNEKYCSQLVFWKSKKWCYHLIFIGNGKRKKEWEKLMLYISYINDSVIVISFSHVRIYLLQNCHIYYMQKSTEREEKRVSRKGRTLLTLMEMRAQYFFISLHFCTQRIIFSYPDLPSPSCSHKQKSS